jgi:hypothetical protein
MKLKEHMVLPFGKLTVKKTKPHRYIDGDRDFACGV